MQKVFKMRETMDGVIIINKPKGYTSHDVVNIVRKQLNMKKVGHTGTLDPNATGVLPILVGQATKISKYLIEHKKTYISTIELGEKRDTGDSEGNIIESDSNIKEFDISIIKQVLQSFLGKQKQIPPMYSAIKVNGKKLYEYARSGQEVEVEPREIEIYRIELIEYINNRIEFEVECSKGTYIRTLCENIAEKLGTIGYMKELQRTSVDKFKIKESINLEELSEDEAQKKILTIENIFKEKEKIYLNDKGVELFLNGVQLTRELEDDVYRVYNVTDKMCCWLQRPVQFFNIKITKLKRR